MPVIVQGELLAGIDVASSPARRAALREWYQRTIDEVADVVPITSEVAEEYARIFGILRRAGRPISSNDIWIAATAIVHDLVVVTSDRDFQHILGITIENWTSL
jgi:predicted nucleic acid-binding protein